MNTGKLITFEGMDGSGKTTQVALLKASLEKSGIEVLSVAEPGGTEIGDEIKSIVKKIRSSVVYPETELFLFQASRAQLVREVIRPALLENKVVLADRFIDSTWVFQSWARGANLLSIEFTNRLATTGVKIDKTFLLQLPLNISMERVRSRSMTDRFEKEDIAFYEKVYAGYNEVAKVYSDRIKVIDANRPSNIIHEDLLNQVVELLG